jgi:hypothetical protein
VKSAQRAFGDRARRQQGAAGDGPVAGLLGDPAQPAGV